MLGEGLFISVRSKGDCNRLQGDGGTGLGGGGLHVQSLNPVGVRALWPAPVMEL